MKTPEERFWAKVDKSAECWIWTGATLPNGYGMLKRAGVNLYAHRASYSMAVGAIPDGMFIDHRCHVKACVNPAHLRLATPKQNTENMRGQNGRIDNQLGVRGVSWSKKAQRYVAVVSHHQQRHLVGFFQDLEEAKAAVIAKRNELFTHNDADRTVAK